MNKKILEHDKQKLSDEITRALSWSDDIIDLLDHYRDHATDWLTKQNIQARIDALMKHVKPALYHSYDHIQKG